VAFIFWFDRASIGVELVARARKDVVDYWYSLNKVVFIAVDLVWRNG
jgi:hypothetical protein